MVTGLVTVSVATIMRRTVLQQHKKLPGKPHLPWGRGWGGLLGVAGRRLTAAHRGSFGYLDRLVRLSAAVVLFSARLLSLFSLVKYE